MKNLGEISTLGVYAMPLQHAVEEFKISGCANLARFLGQTSHESLKFTRVRENLNYAADKIQATFGKSRISEADCWRVGRVDAAVRARTGIKAPDQPANQQALANIVYGGSWGLTNLGNTSVNDGWHFKGHGLIQTTGRENHVQTSKALFGDVRLLLNPEILEDPLQAARSAAFFYTSRGLHLLNDVYAITRKINPGMKGVDDRIEETKRFYSLLNCA